MLSDKTKSILRKSPATLCVALSVALFLPPVVHSAGEPSYAEEIRRYVAEDKVYLLENIRQKVILPAEKLVIDALLSEDGPQAVALYQKQLTQYPDPVLDQISTSRIAAYSLAKESVAPLPKVTIPETPAKNRQKTLSEPPKKAVTIRKERPKPESPAPTTPLAAPTAVPAPVTVTNASEKRPFSLQCGSFKNRDNAETLSKKLSLHASTTIIQQGEFYRVVLKNHYISKEEAMAAAKKLPFETVVVHGQ
ncbi:MAG: SPOR domain-containing protein [Chlorobium sp.]